VDKKEVDFIVSVDNKIWFAVEVKQTDTTVSKSLRYYKERLKIPVSYQIINKRNVDFIKDGVRVISADRFLSNLV
jgi:hypothetical protein